MAVSTDAITANPCELRWDRRESRPEKRILARSSKASSPESNDFNDYPAGNHISSQQATKAPIEVELRSASRRPKRFRKKPQVPPNIQQARECHNNVEKQYRTRLKLRFESLIMAIQGSRPKNDNVGGDDSVDADHCYSRGEVLDAARQRILTLEEENKRLSTRIQELNKSPTIS
ncbi:hypothetical protein FOMG_17794 [Fusarium oxysporum f. sp. melonis 26406]|uniref:BHLH domain-containing protein n=1 Tax=Fusarium oxysporum f. sp. melonis 26406 TaxID=1089452 RepID=W9ZAE4_FUSOX|nr:hypothetical protein FOMG_17794 [Fusarium oxysporum f. sp. melonis 26406]